MSNRWKVVGLIALVILLLFAFTIVRSCQRVNDPPREEDAPRDLESSIGLVHRAPAEDEAALQPVSRARTRSLYDRATSASSVMPKRRM